MALPYRLINLGLQQLMQVLFEFSIASVADFNNDFVHDIY